MPTLPTDPNAPWPPKDQDRTYAKMAEWSAWYSGDPDRLREVYGNTPHKWYRFWDRIGSDPEAQKAQLHVPVAGDLAAVSGALLFGEQPDIRVREAHAATAPAGAKEAEARLRAINESAGLFNRLVEGAEAAAAMGGAYMFNAWDEDLADHPVPSVAQADQAIPEFRHGMLRSVLLWREVGETDKYVYRHLELHLPGVAGDNAVVLHALYKGTKRAIGTRMPEAELASLTGFEPVVDLPFTGLDIEYIPNMRPNRLWRQSDLGLSDYSGSEGLFDALDEVYASWMRDIRLGKARIIVPRDFIDEGGQMDIDHEVYQPMDMEPGAAEQGARAMLAQQFEIRYLEHRETAIELVERIVSNSGYSPQTFGIRIEGRAESGSALRIRENKTILTLKRKSQWWGPSIQRLLSHMMAIDAAVFDGPGMEGMNLDVRLAAGVPEDPVELAQTVAQISAAEAASTETKVRILHPHWSREEVEAEVKRIQDEKKAAKPEPAPPTGMTTETNPRTGEASARSERAIAQDEGEDS